MGTIDLNGFGMREAEVPEHKEYVRKVQDAIEKSKQESGKVRGREGWTSDISDEGV